MDKQVEAPQRRGISVEEVLTWFGADEVRRRDGATVAEAAQALGIAAGFAGDILGDLVGLGYLVRVDGDRCRLGDHDGDLEF